MPTIDAIEVAKQAVLAYLQDRPHAPQIPLHVLGAAADAAIGEDLYESLYDYIDLLPAGATTRWSQAGNRHQLYVLNPFTPDVGHSTETESASAETRLPVTKVHNLATGEELLFTLPAAEAVMAAHLQAIGNMNTWQYPTLFLQLRPTYGRHCIAMGDFCARLPAPAQMAATQAQLADTQPMATAMARRS